MSNINKSNWIRPKNSYGDVCPVYRFTFEVNKKVTSSKLSITALGVYEAILNGKRVGDFVMAPGWTSYGKRHQYQEYDITDMLDDKNELTVTVAPGWFYFPCLEYMGGMDYLSDSLGMIASVEIEYEDGSKEEFLSDEKWHVSESKLRYCHLYNGCTYDSRFEMKYEDAEIFDYTKDTLIPQEGENVTEHERFAPVKYFVTPKGEKVIDFGQNMTGYVEFSVDAKAGDKVLISHAEVLDKDGNFYTENYRSAKAQLEYICSDGLNKYKPTHTFYGFRYIRLDSVPEGFHPEDFTAVAVYSDIKQTGFLNSGHKLLNQFFSNVLWGQKDNFLDVPTDCPQRDERLGWTGDAMAFIKAATYQFDVEKFFAKWLADLASDQGDDGAARNVVPYIYEYTKSDVNKKSSAQWGDSVTVCPWQIYMSYGDKFILEKYYDNMLRWLDYISKLTDDECIWTEGFQFADWLGLDAPHGSYRGSSDPHLVATAYYANSVDIVIKTGRIIGRDVAEYEVLYNKIVSGFRRRFAEYKTQTEHVLALVYSLAQDMQATADSLARLIRKTGHLTTGFAGTPHLLHALSQNGYTDLAYDLLLKEDYPSWLYPVTMGATTVWEHWDGIRPDGSMWSADMNSFNHYGYGAVIDWVFSVAAGINPVEEYAGYERVLIAPNPDPRLGYLDATLKTKYGDIQSNWKYTDDGRVEYMIKSPVACTIVIGGEVFEFDKETEFVTIV